MIFIYITTKNEKEARKIAKYLIEKKLIGCANFHPITSIYPWEGKIVEEKEVALILKTKEGKYEEIKKEVLAIHSYDVPCMIKLPVKMNKEYADWLGKFIS